MRAAGIKKRIDKASKAVQAEITGFASHGGIYARGMAGEGYNGGYLAALQDVLLLLNGCEPNTRFWREEAREVRDADIRVSTQTERT